MSRPFITAIIFFIVLVLGLGLIWPQYQNLRALQLDVAKTKAELQVKEEYFSDLADVSEELKNYEAELSKIDSALPLAPSIPALFDFLQKASSQNGLVLKKIGSFSLAPAKEKSSIKEIHLDFSLSGSYSSLKNFLLTLEKSARVIEVESISFSAPREKETTFTFNLKIKTYSY